MTESELITDLGTIFQGVGTPSVVEAEDALLVTVMQTNVFEEGSSEANRKPAAQRRNIRYYVYKRGQGANEKAYYFQGEPFNASQRDVATTSATLDKVYKIYQSQVLRSRTMSAMIDATNDIINESTGTVDHAKRMKWSLDVLQKQGLMLDTMMMFVSQNPTVQTNGGQVTDNDVSWIVNSSIASTFDLFGY